MKHVKRILLIAIIGNLASILIISFVKMSLHDAITFIFDTEFSRSMFVSGNVLLQVAFESMRNAMLR